VTIKSSLLIFALLWITSVFFNSRRPKYQLNNRRKNSNCIRRFKRKRQCHGAVPL